MRESSNSTEIIETDNEYFENYKHCSNLLKYGNSYECALKALVETEGPIHIEDIYDSIKKIGNLKASAEFKTNIRFCLARVDSIKRKGYFYYDTNYDFENMKVRKREKPKSKRISNIELEKAIVYTLKTESSLSRPKLIKLASSHLGFKSVPPKIKERFDRIIDNKIKKRSIREDNGIIELIYE